MSRFLLTGSAGLVLATLALVTPARADSRADALADEADHAPWRVDLTSSTRWLRDPSAGVVTTSTLDGSGVTAERRLFVIDEPLGPPIELAALAELSIGGAQGSMFQTLTTQTSATDLLAGVHATARYRRYAVLSARAAVGATHVSLEVTPAQSGMVSVDDHAWARTAEASIGAEIDPLSLSSVRLGVGVELGYVATSAVAMHAYPGELGDPALTIPTSYTSIGKLDLDGWSLRIGAHLAF